MKKEKIINFFANGNTTVFINDKQVPKLQKSWCILFAEFLEAKGYDPESFGIVFSSGRHGKFFKTENSWSWKFTL